MVGKATESNEWRSRTVPVPWAHALREKDKDSKRGHARVHLVSKNIRRESPCITQTSGGQCQDLGQRGES